MSLLPGQALTGLGRHAEVAACTPIQAPIPTCVQVPFARRITERGNNTPSACSPRPRVRWAIGGAVSRESHPGIAMPAPVGHRRVPTGGSASRHTQREQRCHPQQACLGFQESHTHSRSLRFCSFCLPSAIEHSPWDLARTFYAWHIENYCPFPSPPGPRSPDGSFGGPSGDVFMPRTWIPKKAGPDREGLFLRER